MPRKPSSATASSEEIQYLAATIQIERTAGFVPDAVQALHLTNALRDLLKAASDAPRIDDELRAALRGFSDQATDLSDELCDAISEYGDRHHPVAAISSEIVAACGR